MDLNASPDREVDSAPPVLEMRGISKTFAGTKVLHNVHIKAWGSEVLGLIGENGAGKSTLMKILSGAYQADPGGEILVDSQKIHIPNPLAAREHGIATIYQEFSLAPNLTVAENIYFGREVSHLGVIDRKGMANSCLEVLARLGATFTPTTVVGTLSIAERQLVEIARAVHSQSKILVMDEPTTTLSGRETDRLFSLIRTLRDEGLAIVYISHRMAEVYELTDRVSVLRDGAYVGTLEKHEIAADRLVRMMVGREISSFYRRDHRVRDGHEAPVLEVRGITDGGHRVHPSSLTLHRGEVLGIAGLVGSGRTELARLIYGADERTAGDIILEGKPYDIRSPRQALDAGIAYLTEDRKAQGLFLDMSCHDNINFGVINRDAFSGGVLNRRLAAERTKRSLKTLMIRGATPTLDVGHLSGGNQQKILLSRWLEVGPRVMILDEPTRGIDIGAKSEFYRLIDQLATNGVGVLVISSELPEIVGICDRVLVMREGRIEGEVGGGHNAKEITQENIMAYATGVEL